VHWVWSEDVEHLYPLDAFLTLELINYIDSKKAIRFAEIGVWKGGWIRTLCQNNEAISGYGVDPYPGLTDIKHYFLKSMNQNRLESRVELISSIQDLPHEKFDLFHIDACHQQSSVSSELNFASEHLTENGIITVDDVWHKMYPGVAAAVFSFLTNSNWASFAITRNKMYLCRDKYQPHYFSATIDIADRNRLGYSLGVSIGEKTGKMVHTYSTSNSINGFPQVNFVRYSNLEIAQLLNLPTSSRHAINYYRTFLRVLKSRIKPKKSRN